MFGWINDCTEQLVVTKFGIEKWHEIKKIAGCDVKDFGFVRHQYYPDSSTVALVVAASQVLGISVDAVLEAFGCFFMEFVRKNGYENLLNCQGSNLRSWLSNLNALHDHLESSLPPGLVAPVFWCEDCDDPQDGSILLHYYSKRGNLLVPLVVGVVKEVARFHFDVSIVMERRNMQDVDGSEFTTWRIITEIPEDMWKLTKYVINMEKNGQHHKVRRRSTMQHSNTLGHSSSSSNAEDDHRIEVDVDPANEGRDEEHQDDDGPEIPIMCPFSGISLPSRLNGSSKPHNCPKAKVNELTPGVKDGLTAERMKDIFPYHVMVNHNFEIVQVGSFLLSLLNLSPSRVIGHHIQEILIINRPILARWDWPTLSKLEDQIFFLVPTKKSVSINDNYRNSHGTSNRTTVKFKASMIVTSPGGNVHDPNASVMFVLSPDVKNVTELSDMGLTMSDLPAHSFQRDAVFLGEHIASEVRSAHMLDKLSKKLESEKNLSNQLLYNMLPRSVADELRSGRTVEPCHFEKVTLFFSDVVGFTSICDKIAPWDIIDMLNQLYSVMDYLASKFKLYKVETIGDAYMCCSGMPIPDDYHAENIANFAIAAMECVKHVLNPVENAPIRLRIGIHTGEVMGGVVGTLTPHYCLFGDMVNTTSRHESTGLPGMVQCSSALYGRLKHFSPFKKAQFNFTPRGLVPMKGKGECYTYWLDGGTSDNQYVNPQALNALYDEVGEMLSKKRWKKRRYFRRAINDGSSVTGSDGFTVLDQRTNAATSTACSSDLSYDQAMMESQDLFLDDNENGDKEKLSGIKDDDDDQDKGDDVSSNADAEADLYIDIDQEQELVELDQMIDASYHSRRGSVGSVVTSQTSFSPHNDGTWKHVSWDPNLTREDLVHCVHSLLARHLRSCLISESDEYLSKLDTSLLNFVQRISHLYRKENRFHNWRHACHVTLSASFLVERWLGEEEGNDKWLLFAVTFAALIHDVKHLGVTNKFLEDDHHVLSQVFDNSFQERQSIQAAMSIFVEDFPELSTAVLKGCPLFLRIVTCVILATDIASKDAQSKFVEKYERIQSGTTDNEKIEGILEHILLVADVAHCSQRFDTFLIWNRAFYEECLVNNTANKGFDPRNGWFEGQINFLKGYVLPLTERCDKLLGEKSVGLTKRVEANLKHWDDIGRGWTDQMIDSLVPNEDGDIAFQNFY